MSSLTRRMQRANARRTGTAKSRAGKDPDFGSKIGVHNEEKKVSRRARGQRRRTKPFRARQHRESAQAVAK